MNFKILSLIGLVLVLFACEKGAGEGGNSTIVGSVMVEEWNKNLTEKRSEHPARGEDVYIVYGDDDFYGDKVETYYDGTYKFEFLRKGRYTIYVYSKDTLNPADKSIVSATVDITGKKQTITVPQLTIINDNGDDGIYSITGHVKLEQYSDDYSVKRSEYDAKEADVYIRCSDEEFYFDRVRTDENGNYLFANLIAGEYIVFSYSEDASLANNDKAVVEQVVVVDEGVTLQYLASEIVIKDNEGDKGNATIRGKVIMEEWNGDFTIKRDEYPAQDLDVFLMRVGDLYYLNSVKTNYNGIYEFDNVAPGNYIVYAYSKDKNINYDITDRMVIVSVSTTVTTENELVDLVGISDIRVKN